MSVGTRALAANASRLPSGDQPLALTKCWTCGASVHCSGHPPLAGSE